jgi:hypothetical protein
MRSRSEREIARRLSERGEVEPPADLLARIQAEIPLKPLTIHAADAQEARAGRFRARQAWLIAASLLAMIGTGLFSLHVFEGKRELTAPRAAVERSARPAVPPPPPANAAAPPSRPLEQHLVENAVPAAGMPAKGKPEPPVEPRGEVAEGGVGGSPDMPEQNPTGAVAEPASPPPPSSSPASPKPLASAGSPVSAPQKTGAEPDRRENVANAEDAAPRAEAMTLKKELQTGLAEGGFIDAATSPRDDVGPQADASSLERERSAAAESRRFSARQPTDTPAGLAGGDGGAEVDASPSPPAEGAPSPFAAGERRRLLLFHRPERADPGSVEVEINPQVVARYRRVSVTGATLLYEVELKPGAGEAGAAAPVATLLGGARLRIADFAPSWAQATPGFRLAFLVAKLDELEKIPRGRRPRGDLAELLKGARTLAAELSGDRRAQELLGEVERLSP